MIGEHMPTVAKQMKHLSVIRSLNSKEGNHDRGEYMMHTGYSPNPTVVHPAFGSVLSYELGEKLENFDLPHCIAINRPAEGAGFLGMAHSPFVVNNPNGKIANLDPPKEINEMRMGRRVQMLGLTEDNFAAQKRGQGGIDHKAVYAKTLRMMNSKYTDAFKLDKEPAAVRDAYGKSSFGSGCLMARRLVEAGVTYCRGLPRRLGHPRRRLQRPLHPAPARPRQGDGHPGRRPRPARVAGEHDGRLDGRIRPDSPDQPEWRP